MFITHKVVKYRLCRVDVNVKNSQGTLENLNHQRSAQYMLNRKDANTLCIPGVIQVGDVDAAQTMKKELHMIYGMFLVLNNLLLQRNIKVLMLALVKKKREAILVVPNIVPRKHSFVALLLIREEVALLEIGRNARLDPMKELNVHSTKIVSTIVVSAVIMDSAMERPHSILVSMANLYPMNSAPMTFVVTIKVDRPKPYQERHVKDGIQILHITSGNVLIFIQRHLIGEAQKTIAGILIMIMVVSGVILQTQIKSGKTVNLLKKQLYPKHQLKLRKTPFLPLLKEIVMVTRRTTHSREDCHFKSVLNRFNWIPSVDLTFLGVLSIYNASAAQMVPQIPIVQQLIAFTRLSITSNLRVSVSKKTMILNAKP